MCKLRTKINCPLFVFVMISAFALYFIISFILYQKPLPRTESMSLSNSYVESYIPIECSVVSNSLQPARLLCPWHLPGENTGVGHHLLL